MYLTFFRMFILGVFGPWIPNLYDWLVFFGPWCDVHKMINSLSIIYIIVQQGRERERERERGGPVKNMCFLANVYFFLCFWGKNCQILTVIMVLTSFFYCYLYFTHNGYLWVLGRIDLVQMISSYDQVSFSNYRENLA